MRHKTLKWLVSSLRNHRSMRISNGSWVRIYGTNPPTDEGNLGTMEVLFELPGAIAPLAFRADDVMLLINNGIWQLEK